MPNTQVTKPTSAMTDALNALREAEANVPKDATGKPVDPKLLKNAKDVSAKPATKAAKAQTDKRSADMLANIAGVTLSDDVLGERIRDAIRDAAGAEVRAQTTARVNLATAFELVAAKLLREHIAEPTRSFANAIIAEVKALANEEIVDKRDYTKGKGLAPPKGPQIVTLRKIRLWQTVSGQTLTYAARAAALLADTNRTRVVVGYLPLKGGRMPHTLIDKTFNASKPKSGDYLAAVCVPQNVLEPKEHRGVARKPDAEGAYKAEMVITNPVTDLRMVSEQHLNTLYFHHFFDGATQPALRYADTTRDPQWAPSGMLLPMNGAGQYPAATRAAKAGTGATTATTLLSSLSDNDPVKLAITLGQSFRSAPINQWRPQGKVDQAVAAWIEAVAILINRSCEQGLWDMPVYREGPAGAALADLCNTVNTVCKVDPSGKASVLNSAGSWLPLGTDAAPVIPAPKIVEASKGSKGKGSKAA